MTRASRMVATPVLMAAGLTPALTQGRDDHNAPRQIDNARAAVNTLGIAVAPAPLARADEVIE